VKRNWTAAEFERDLAGLCARYTEEFVSAAAKIRTEYVGKSPNNDREGDQLLEAHVRVFIDGLLAALNWQPGVETNAATNLVPESPVYSEDRARIRFLDYLGFEARNPQKPLLIVEAKRPSSSLPRTKASVGLSEPPIQALLSGLGGADMIEDWSSWISTARDYVRSIAARSHYIPKRLVVTNGDWMIVFTDPDQTFCQDQPDRRSIRVFTNRDELLLEHTQIFALLEHQQVLGSVQPLAVEELAFYAASADIDRILHGLRLMYQVDHDFYAAVPNIKVMPVIHLRTRGGLWLVVEERMTGEVLPQRPEHLAEHCSKVSSIALKLIARVRSVLGLTLLPTTVAEHYRESEPSDYPVGLLGSRRVLGTATEEYIIATGTHTHYFKLRPTVAGCPHHGIDETGRAPLELSGQNMKPRVFFVLGQDQRCCHTGVHREKRILLQPDNRQRCGPRSGENMQAFCEIFKFEESLCCRACAFEEVCTRAPAFVLPCLVDSV
jgi:hypothetical protein